jgi:phage FluMu protein Com
MASTAMQLNRCHGEQVHELRCCCNRLLAKVEGTTVVLKCPRCKRQAVLSLCGEHEQEVEVTFSDGGSGDRR